MDASRFPIDSEDGFSELDRVAFAESLPELDDSQDWSWIDSDRDVDDFYNDDMLMGVDA